MDREETIEELLHEASIISLSFTDYSAHFVIDEFEEDFPEDGIDIEIEPQVRLRWAFSDDAKQILIRAALKVETPLVEVCVEVRAEYKFPEGIQDRIELDRELLHLFACFVADRDLHSTIRSEVQSLSLKLLQTPILLPVGSPFGAGHLDRI
ncbi:hypothetical protein ACT3UD_18245 [Glutamicibacter sp. 287]|uniref:hypothetical protein n=1 Tax=unclassified Glutamicibacter TaxID=2627139 RepID=UPI004034528E